MRPHRTTDGTSTNALVGVFQPIFVPRRTASCGPTPVILGAWLARFPLVKEPRR